MLRRPRPGGGRHPPPLAPTVSNFKPRAQWSTLESFMSLNVHLPGFYMDQIKITKDEKARTIKIEGERPLSTQTKARFNEVYRVPDSCDMTKLNTSFSHGLLTIEFPVVVESEKAGKVGNDKGKTVQRPNHEENRGRTLRRSNLSDKERQVGATSQEKGATPKEKKEEPKTYKSVVEGKREVPTASRGKTEHKVKEGEASPSLGRKEHTKQEKVVEKKEGVRTGQQKTVQKVKEGEAIPSLGRKEHTKQEKVVDKKEAVRTGQQKTLQKVKEEEARSTPNIGGSLKAKVPAQEDRVTERKTEQKVKEGVTKTPTIGASSEHKMHAKAERVIERKGDGEKGQKLKEEGKINLGQKKQEEYTKPVVGDKKRRAEKEIDAANQAAPELNMKQSVGSVVERKGDGETVQKLKEEERSGLGQKKEEKHTKPADGDEARRTEKEISASNPELKTKEGVERTAGDVNGHVISKDDEKMVGDKVSKGEIQEEVGEKKVESAIGGEDREKMVEKSSEPETDLLLVKGHKETNMDPRAAEGSGLEKEESHKYGGISLVNVGVASLVIMVFGAYVFVPLVKMFY